MKILSLLTLFPGLQQHAYPRRARMLCNDEAFYSLSYRKNIYMFSLLSYLLSPCNKAYIPWQCRKTLIRCHYSKKPNIDSCYCQIWPMPQQFRSLSCKHCSIIIILFIKEILNAFYNVKIYIKFNIIVAFNNF